MRKYTKDKSSVLQHHISRRGFLGGLSAVTLGASSNRTGAPSEYPLFRARGTHRDLGRQHGEQAAERIKQHVDLIRSSQKISRQQLHRRALRFRPLFEQYCPHLFEEMSGLAEGAGVPLAEALACNIRGEIGHAKEEGCTAYAIGREGAAERAIIAGQNRDMNSDVMPLAYV